MPRTAHNVIHADGSSLWDGIQPDSSRRLLVSALNAFSLRGYHAATTRQIAEGAEMSPAAVYVHYRSKADLLYEISRIGHTAALRAVEDALADVAGERERLRALIEAFVGWHAANHTLARVLQYEIHALQPKHFRVVRGLRRRVDEIVERELQAGVDSKDFVVDDMDITKLALLSLGIDVARWYTDHGPEPSRLASHYADILMRSVVADR